MRLVEPGLVGDNPGTEGPGVEWARALLDSLQMRRVRDPLAAEMAASVVAASWRPEAHDGPFDPAEVSAGQLEAAPAEMIDAIAAVRRTDALVLLVGLAAVAPGPLASRALESAATLETSGVRAPRWLAEVGRAEVVGAWRMSHVLGDGDNVVLGARYPAGSEHSLVVYVDHNLGGLAKDVFPAGPADEVLTMFADAAGHDPDMSITPMELADAAAWVRGALAVTDRMVPPIETEDYPAIRPLLDARLDTLPPAGDGPTVVELSPSQRRQVIDQFLDSDHGRRWRGDEHARPVLEQLVRFRCDDGDHRPLRWSPVLAEMLLLDWWPREGPDDPALRELLPDVLVDWVTFAADATGLQARHLDDIVDSVETWADADPNDLEIVLGRLDDENPYAGDGWVDLDTIDIVFDGPDEPAPTDQILEAMEWTGIPTALREKVEAIVASCDRACEAVLDAEYQDLAHRLVGTLARKRPSPLQRGRPEIWAGGVLWALGQANWLFARNATVHVNGEQLAAAVGAKPKSIAAKATVVRDAANMAEFDLRFTRRELLEMGLFGARLMYRY